MVTVAVLAVVMSIAIPSYTYLINSSRLTAAANEMVASLQLARSEAIRLNRNVAVCRSDNGSSCAAGGAWNQWITIVVTDSTVLRVSTVKAPVQMSVSAAVSGNNDRIVFSPDGVARNSTGMLLNAGFSSCIATTRPSDNLRVVYIAGGSRVAFYSTPGNVACPAPSDSPSK
nr:GspH/FimT family pseudopilin [Xanthomonas sacchari]